MAAGEELFQDRVQGSDDVFQLGVPVDPDDDPPTLLSEVHYLAGLQVGKFVYGSQHEPSPSQHNWGGCDQLCTMSEDCTTVTSCPQSVVGDVCKSVYTGR